MKLIRHMFFYQSYVVYVSLNPPWNDDTLHFESEVCGVNSLVIHQRRLETADLEPMKNVHYSSQTGIVIGSV